MKKITFLLLTILLVSITTQAGLKRVGFTGAQLAGIDYTTLQLAHDAATTLAGDTIQVYPSITGSGFTQTKKLIIIGIGYYTAGTGLNANLNSITTGTPIDIGNIYYTSASTGVAGSEYQGLRVGCVIQGSVAALVNNISFLRCDFVGFNGVSSPAGNLSNLKFRQCINIGNVSFIFNSVTLSGCVIENSILSLNHFMSAAGSWAIGSTCYFKNCSYVLNLSSGGAFSFGNYSCLAENCIFQSNSFSNYANTTFNNCFLSRSGLTALSPAVTGSGNIFTNDADAGNVFVGYPTQGSFSNDGKWVLKAGSPAIGFGTGGVDNGIYGGATPYKLSGIPATPAFYKLSAPSTNAISNPYQITFSVRSNN